ncbi:MAG TPA: peptide chain release factor N(5)-glutamine methyltransferase [Acidimicrobiales bacterium]|nr:peptide chain release factor N(5)-glutamine methyltransferase [Acidimicrobiales bacterium]
MTVAETWRDLLDQARHRLASDIDARRILEQASGYEGAEWVRVLDEPVPPRAAAHFEAMVVRREAGEPLQYVVGRWGFRSLDLMLDSRVLIPRPETEQVVEAAAEEIRRHSASLVADLGTGSGAVALALAAEVPGIQVWATDTSEAALAVARANLAGLGGLAATKVRLAHGSWFSALPAELRGRLSVVVSNPPYVAEAEVADLPAEVAAWEPREALVAGPSGLEAIEAVLAEAPRWLGVPGAVVIETAPHHQGAATSMARDAGFTEVEVHPDLGGLPRILIGRLL